MVYLGERSAAFEDNLVLECGITKEFHQDPTNPEIFFSYSWMKAPIGSCLPEEVPSVPSLSLATLSIG